MKKDANIGVVHQRIASNTAAMYSKGRAVQSQAYNNAWSNYMNEEFQAPEHQMKQEAFNSKNRRMKEAISHKVQKQEMKMKPKMSHEPIIEEA